MEERKNELAIPKNLNEIKWEEIERYNLSDKGKLVLRNSLLNVNPPDAWLQTNPLSGNKYLPIDKVEYLLTAFFGHWYVEIKETKLVVNSILTTIRLYYRVPEQKNYFWQDGEGAWPLQVDKGKKPTDIEALKAGAVQMAAPSSKSMAIKDAAEEIGRVFGRDISRKNLIDYSKLFNEDYFKDAKITEK